MTTTSPEATMDLQTATPAEIDGRWVPLMAATDRAEYRLMGARQHLAHAEKQGLTYYIERAREGVEAAEAAVDAAHAAEGPFETEWSRRGGWTRGYLAITNGRGHVHRSTHCSTCHRGYERTALTILPQVSGLTEAEIVDLAGERACTVCFPDAPVETLTRATRLFSEDEKVAAAAREARDAERAVKAAAKAAKAITNPDGSPLRDHYDFEIKTERTAWIEVADLVYNSTRFGYQAHEDVQAAIVAALAAKLGQTEAEIRATVAAKVEAKAKRNR